ncbi:LuxR family transcriptional regulator [Cereibacter ovatus]|uniref:LuxR family transcriptional regulator n=1 Tax=Cereibacter ovatus TaxID=439529 RepID=A0A285CLS0_9RHOB|nr:autoinducer binding domain-containing protein [Cereibacter ovatus]SNX68502.1 LuxR family transcriptional regulator [Cereibacter ovatus]
MAINSKLDLEIGQVQLIAPSGHFIGLHIRFASPLVVLHGYCQDWLDYYTEQGFVIHDPTVLWGFANTGVRRWRDFVDCDPRGVFSAAAQFDLRYGVTCAFGPSRSRSLGNFARSDREFTDGEMQQLDHLIQRLHAATEPAEELTTAQVEALRCIANGDRHAAAALKLGISESALKARLVSARQRLGARTTAEAIQRAKDSRLI